MKRKRSVLKKAGILAAAASLLASGFLTGLTGCGQAETKEQGTLLATLGEEEIFLEEAVFYTRMLQESWEYTYYEYYGEEMWQEEVDPETGTLAEALKRDVLEALTEIHLLCAHAEEYGVKLTVEEQKNIAARAKNFMAENTPEVLEAAGATEETVADFLLRNQLAAKVSEAVQNGYEPEIEEEAARVGKLSYALFATTGIFDAQGNQTPFTEEELTQIRQEAEDFALRAQELGSISAAGEEAGHTVIDVYFNEETDGGAHERVAEKARQMEVGGISDIVEAEEGYYIVQRVSEYDEAATLENIEAWKDQERRQYSMQLLESWRKETPLQMDAELWKQVKIEGMLTDPEVLE